MKRDMRPSRKPVLVSICLIALGVGWLLTNAGVLAGVNWVWTLSLASAAIVVLAAGGIDKVTVVVGPLLMLASVGSVARQTGRLSVDYEVPCLVIAAGVLVLVSHLAPVPPPAWLIDDSRGAD